MAGFNELISDFEKIREYIRDFYVYGFLSREDFSRKSLRTYDNERRRIESFLGDYVQWNYVKAGKTSFISVDASVLPVNPLYAVWKSKSFVANDIMLHFYILDTLRTESPQSITSIVDHVCLQSGELFGLQTVRNKCNHYVELGLLSAEKTGRAFEYSLNSDSLTELLPNSKPLLNAISFFQGVAPFGVVGDFILDQQQVENTTFVYQHQFIVHSLEEQVLLELVRAIREQRSISFENTSRKTQRQSRPYGVPLEIRVSTGSGRRYLVLEQGHHKYYPYRLDAIKDVVVGDVVPYYEDIKTQYQTYRQDIWGSSMASHREKEIICLKLQIDPIKEPYVLERLAHEGHGGEILQLDDTVFLYTLHVHDANESSSWIKTFTGRILALETTNNAMYHRFYSDMKRMYQKYLGGSDGTL